MLVLSEQINSGIYIILRLTNYNVALHLFCCCNIAVDLNNLFYVYYDGVISKSHLELKYFHI